MQRVRGRKEGRRKKKGKEGGGRKKGRRRSLVKGESKCEIKRWKVN